MYVFIINVSSATKNCLKAILGLLFVISSSVHESSETVGLMPKTVYISQSVIHINQQIVLIYF